MRMRGASFMLIVSLSLPLDERRADVIVIVGKSVHTANDPLLLDSRFAKKEKKK